MIYAGQAKYISNTNNELVAANQLAQIEEQIIVAARTGATHIRWLGEFYGENQNALEVNGFELSRVSENVVVTDKVGNTIYSYLDDDDVSHVIGGYVCEGQLIYGYLERIETESDGEISISYNFITVDLNSNRVSPVYQNENVGWLIDWSNATPIDYEEVEDNSDSSMEFVENDSEGEEISDFEGVSESE